MTTDTVTFQIPQPVAAEFETSEHGVASARIAHVTADRQTCFVQMNEEDVNAFFDWLLDVPVPLSGDIVEKAVASVMNYFARKGAMMMNGET